MFTNKGSRKNIERSPGCEERKPQTLSFLHDQNRCSSSIMYVTMSGKNSHIFSAKQFTFKDGRPGVVQSFIIVDETAHELGHEVWTFKITAWNNNVSKLNIIQNKTYTVSKCKIKPSTNKTKYSWKPEYELHMTEASKISEILLDITFSVE